MLIRLLATLLMGSAISYQVNADEQLTATIEEGLVISSPSFCPPDQCQAIESLLNGTVSFTISDDEIIFNSSNLSTQANIGFVLPKDPSSNENGTVNSIEFSFDGEGLIVEGSSDQRAFDGPLLEYFFEASITNNAEEGFIQNDYYHARQDQRKCTAPLCGGIFVERVNRRKMRCPDGSRARSCYIAEVDFSQMGQDPFLNVSAFDGSLLLQGEVKNLIYKHFGNVGLFEIAAAYEGYGDPFPRRGRYAGVRNNGILCITSPCFSYDKLPLNSQRIRKLSGVDFSQLNINESRIEQLQQQLANGDTLITFGKNKRIQGFAGKGVELVVQQVFLPVSFPVEPDDCLTGACPEPPFPLENTPTSLGPES